MSRQTTIDDNVCTLSITTNDHQEQPPNDGTVSKIQRCVKDYNIKLCTWNINGFVKWKQNHKDVVNNINTCDITLFVETWLTDEDWELIKQT